MRMNAFMVNNDIDNQTAKLIALVDLYVDKNKCRELNFAAEKAAAILIRGIRDSSEIDKIDFCTVAIIALSKYIVSSLASRNLNNVLEREELDFISAQNIW